MLDLAKYFRLINILIKLIAYSGVLVGLWLIFYQPITSMFRTNYYASRFRRRIDYSENKKKANPLERHIQMLLTVVINNKSNYIVYSFFFISFMLFFLTYIITFRQMGRGTSILISILIGLIPYIYLQVKLRTIQVEGSFEAEGLLLELTNQYKINYFNMTEAIDKTITFLDKYPHSKRMLFRLSLEIKEYQKEEELHEILKQFVFASGTEWSMQLANNLFLAIHEGTNVQVSLDDIISDLKGARTSLEESNRLNNESIVIVKYVAPLTYFATVFIAIKYFGFSIQKFINYQINNGIGLRFFLLVLITMVINYCLIVVIKNQKFDF